MVTTLQGVLLLEGLDAPPPPPEPPLPTDVCERRHGGNAESEAANLRVDKDRDRGRVLEVIQARGLAGATLDEVSLRLDVAPNRISGRITELKKLGLIRASRQRRPTRTGATAAVYVPVYH